MLISANSWHASNAYRLIFQELENPAELQSTNLEIGDRDRENRTQDNASQVKRKRHMHLPDTWARIKSVHPHTRGTVQTCLCGLASSQSPSLCDSGDLRSVP